jgi:hypothetical protein
MIQLENPGEMPPPGENEEPPVFDSWRNIYLFVLGVHALIIILFYLLTHAYA